MVTATFAHESVVLRCNLYICREHVSRHSASLGLQLRGQESRDANEHGDKNDGTLSKTDKDIPNGLSPSAAVAKAASAITGAMKSLLPIGTSPSSNVHSDGGDLLRGDSRKAKQDDYESDDDDEDLHLRLATTSRNHDLYDEEEADDWGDDGGWKTHNVDRRRKTQIATSDSGGTRKGVFNVFNW